ncbi:MAG: hypothetical protein LBR87_08975, partial [Synergistaceae bacterium]|nr:hypothetical protein [Synergistaceae bacterium]
MNSAAPHGLVSVAIPGPWWTGLTYSAPRECSGPPERGARVRVPVGRGSRIAVV